MILNNRLFSTLFIILFATIRLLAQGLGNSPYSTFGIGDVLSEGTIRNQGIGGAGIGSPDVRFINYTNPALLVINKVVTFEGGLVFQQKTLTSNTESQNTNGSIPSYAIMAFPISKNWTTTIGIRPKSVIFYERSYSEEVVGDSLVSLYVTEKGDGGLNTVFFGHGIKLNKRFSFGAEGSYNFGRKEVESEFSLDPISAIEQNVLVRRENFRGFGYKLGAFYNTELDSGKTVIGLGLVFEGATNYVSDLFVSRQTQNIGLALTEDTFIVSKGSMQTPPQVSVGFGIKRVNKWTFSADIAYSPWSQFQSSFQNPEARNLINYRAGIEYIPNFGSVSNVFARSIYRLGAYYDPYAFSVNDIRFDEFGMNFGFSMPVNKINFLNFSLSVGRRGTLENNLIIENFARLSFGLTINDPTWFRRFKLD